MSNSLKQMLNIGGPPKSNSVQEFFQSAAGAGGLGSTQGGEISHCRELIELLGDRGMGVPRYDYVMDGGMVAAQVCLGDGSMYHSPQPCVDRKTASEGAAEAALQAILRQGNRAHHQGNRGERGNRGRNRGNRESYGNGRQGWERQQYENQAFFQGFGHQEMNMSQAGWSVRGNKGWGHHGHSQGWGGRGSYDYQGKEDYRQRDDGSYQYGGQNMPQSYNAQDQARLPFVPLQVSRKATKIKDKKNEEESGEKRKDEKAEVVGELGVRGKESVGVESLTVRGAGRGKQSSEMPRKEGGGKRKPRIAANFNVS